MEQKPTPKAFKRTSKLPSEEQLQKMKEQVQTQPSKKGGKHMAETDKGGKGKPRKRITSEQVARMIKEWDDKSIQGWADELDVSYQTVSKMAEVVRKADDSLCKKKSNHSA